MCDKSSRWKLHCFSFVNITRPVSPPAVLPVPMDFFVPLDPHDLESPPAGRFGVKKVLDVESASVDDVIDKLNDSILNSKDVFATVLDSATFDPAYSLVKCVVPPRARVSRLVTFFLT